MLQTYGVNKLVSVVLPLAFLLLVLSFYPIDAPVSWWILIVAAHTLGYMHFVLGFIYQARSVVRSKHKKKVYLFVLLTSSAVLISLGAALFNMMSLLSIFAIGYFIFHGAMNESTLMLKQFGYSPGLRFMLPVGLYILPFFLLALPHPSFFFTPQLFFLNPTPAIAMEWLTGVVTFDVLQIISFACLGLFILLVPMQLLYKGKYIAAASILCTVFLTARLFVDEYPLNYIVLYFLFLTYHFISWSFYFYQSFRQHAPERIPAYLRDHLLVVVPLLLLSAASMFDSSALALHHIVFNGGLFITCAMIHNTTSILNEEWFGKMTRLTPRSG